MSWVYRRPPDVRQRRKRVPPATRGGPTAHSRTVSDDVDVTDSTTRVVDAARIVTDPVGVTDDITAVKTITVEISELVGVTDDVTDDLTAGVQFLRPDSDVDAGGWTPTPSSPTTLFDKLDEVTPSDTDFITEA